ncbi:hypothetical protein [Amycolatopsis sp. CA-126428]|uniref:hypothetical protein n=1 Tax=Amycolatopsis sp. CA-126428 TaxID=2073158 RepID=UPI0011AFE6C8|nr:hypothetical protein [Amycolatopsis sp. CA-126428]
MRDHQQPPASRVEAAPKPMKPARRGSELLYLQRAAGNRATADLVVAQRFGGGLATAMPAPQLAGAMTVTGIVGSVEGAALVSVVVDGAAGVAAGAAAVATSPVVLIGLAVIGTGVLIYLAAQDWQRYSQAAAAPAAAPRPRLPDEATIPRAAARPSALTPGNLVGPFAATLAGGITATQIRQHIVVRERTRGQNCVPPNPAPLVAWVLTRAMADLPDNLRRFWSHRSGVPQTTMAVRRDRRRFLRELRRAMNCAMVAAKCDGEIVGFAQGNKYVDERRHAEEFALDEIKVQLRPRSRAELTGGTLLSVCEQVPCNGQYAGKNCDRLLRQYWNGKSHGGAVTGLATGWPPGYDAGANAVYNTAWENLYQRSMSAAMRVPLL